MLEVLFRTRLFFSYMKILLRSFSFWDIEIVKPKFQPIYTYKKGVWNVKKGNWLLRRLIFEIFLSNLFSNLAPVRKNNFRKVYFQFPKINSTKGDFKCKTTHKLHRKQFNVLNDEYWKFFIYNNPSFATTNFAEVCLDIAFDFKFRDLLILMAIFSQK